jgi:glycosyltransferase involved in cell wall biosynthesis
METFNIVLIAPPYRAITPNYFDYGGIEVGVANLAEHFANRGHRVTVFGSYDKDNAWIPKDGLMIAIGKSEDYLTKEKHVGHYASAIMKNAQFMEVIKRADIVNNNEVSQIFSFIKSKNHNENYISSLHAMDIFTKNLPIDTKLRFVTPSYHLAKVLSRINWEKYVFRTLHPGPVKADRYPYQAKKKDGLLYLGRMYEPKGAHRAIQIAEKLEMPIDIVGGSEDDDVDFVVKIKRMCEESPYATYRGKVSYEDKVKYYQNAAAVLLPCLEFYNQSGDNCNVWVEPFGNITVEAGLCGTPSIVTPSGGWAETISHGWNGFFANTDEEFINAFNHINDIKPAVCRERAKYFCAEAGGERYLELYKKVLDGDIW